MIELFPSWFMALPNDKKKMVTRWQNHRAVALLKFSEGRMSEAVARRIVAKCNLRIEKIAKGAAVL